MNNTQTEQFEVVVRPHRAALHRFALGLARNPSDAEDLVQETLLRAFTYWHTFRYEGEAAARSWLCTILRNRYLDHCHAQQRQPPLVLLDLFPEEAASFLGSRRFSTTPERIVLAQQEVRALARAVAALPAPYQRVLLLAIHEGLSYHEIADRLRIPIGTVRSRLSRGRKRVQRALAVWQG